MALRTRNAVVLAKIESTTGTDAAPTGSADAVLVENPRATPSANLIRTNEVTGSLDQLGSIVGGIRATVEFDVLLRGSGSPAVAPEWGKLMRVCGMQETLTTTAVPAAAETLAAGGSTTSAVLGASAVGTAQLYRGMPILLTGAQAGTSFIADYSAAKLALLTDTFGGALVATTNYQIPLNVRYGQASTSIASVTVYVYMDGVLYKLVGCRGSWSLAVETGGIGRLTFRFDGMYVSKTDAAVATPVYDNEAVRPPVVRGGAMTVNKLAAAIANLSLDSGNTLTMPPNPNAAEGFDPPEITARNMTGSINPLENLTATNDWMGDFRAGTKRILHERWGTVAGNRFGITIPAGLYTAQNPADRDGLMAVDLPFEATGRDSGVFLTQW